MWQCSRKHDMIILVAHYWKKKTITHSRKTSTVNTVQRIMWKQTCKVMSARLATGYAPDQSECKEWVSGFNRVYEGEREREKKRFSTLNQTCSRCLTESFHMCTSRCVFFVLMRMSAASCLKHTAHSCFSATLTAADCMFLPERIKS